MEIDKFTGSVLIHNIQKPRNIGMIIRSAAAFNIKKIFLICKNQSKLDVKLKNISQFFNFYGN